MPMDKKWLDWTSSNLKGGSAPAEIRLMLKQHGFSDKDIKFALKKTLSKHVFQRTMRNVAIEEEHQGRNPDVDYEALANNRLVRSVDGTVIVNSDGVACRVNSRSAVPAISTEVPRNW